LSLRLDWRHSDFIIREGESGSEMFFIRKGTAHVSSVVHIQAHRLLVLRIQEVASRSQVLQKQLVKLADLGSSQDNSSRRFSRFSSAGPRVNIPGYKFLRALSDGDSFGELSMLFDRRRTATVVAATILELASLSKADFVHVIQEFPELAPEFEKNIGGYAMVSVVCICFSDSSTFFMRGLGLCFPWLVSFFDHVLLTGSPMM
jgi:CRP-like cAMP-binding protein